MVVRCLTSSKLLFSHTNVENKLTLNKNIGKYDIWMWSEELLSVLIGKKSGIPKNRKIKTNKNKAYIHAPSYKETYFYYKNKLKEHQCSAIVPKARNQACFEIKKKTQNGQNM